MKYLDEFRDSKICDALAQQIGQSATRCRSIMEVCGGQTHGLLRNGIDRLLEGSVALIHGPGCPVCVTPAEVIDFAVELARQPQNVLVSFGDMLRVPGSRHSLMQARSEGADVRIVYSPLDAVRLAQQNPARSVVFLAVGFETTAPATALAVQQAAHLGLSNFFLLVAHVRVLPAMEGIVREPDCSIDGFLAAGHVCAVTGYHDYHTFCAHYRRPIVVTGFEPVDLLTGILECVRQIERGAAGVANCYTRSVAPQGNERAAMLVSEVFEVCDSPWRGLGVIPRGGLRLREDWSAFDADRRFQRGEVSAMSPNRCRSGEVLTGRIKPTQCEYFARECRPETPLGAPMVSSEGACAAYYQFGRDSVERGGASCP